MKEGLFSLSHFQICTLANYLFFIKLSISSVGIGIFSIRVVPIGKKAFPPAASAGLERPVQAKALIRRVFLQTAQRC